MEVPPKIRGLKWLTIIVGLYGVVWLSLEGAIGQVIVLALGLALLGAGYVTQRLIGGRELPLGHWLLFAGALGAITGLACGLLVLALMAIKTGLHGHGPEFTASQIEWAVGQIPLWMLSGTIAGLGLGLLALAFRR
ncbi:MAG: hypothetical protein JSW55_11365 [Chloroflexota bacterium]|nr:MAG: hypothetical protein JSW55_11365 [Chloroflexota bacterium]